MWNFGMRNEYLFLNLKSPRYGESSLQKPVFKKWRQKLRFLRTFLFSVLPELAVITATFEKAYNF
jgi:hypothetical protein